MSPTQKTGIKRSNKKKKGGRARKAKLAKNGSTPAFPIHQNG